MTSIYFMAVLLQIEPSMSLAFAVAGNSADWCSTCAPLTPCILFCKAVFQVLGPQPVLLHGFIPPEVQDFAFVELARLLLAHFFSLSKSLNWACIGSKWKCGEALGNPWAFIFYQVPWQKMVMPRLSVIFSSYWVPPRTCWGTRKQAVLPFCE